MNKASLEKGIEILREAVEANITLLLDLNAENRERAEHAQTVFESWCEECPVEFQYMDDNFVG